MVINAESLKSGPKVRIPSPAVGILYEKIERENRRCLVALHSLRRTYGRPGGETRS